MVDQAMELGFVLAAALGTILYAVEKFVGAPTASFVGMKEAKKVLGFSPLMPTWLPEGWTLHTYYAAINDNKTWFYSAYTSDQHEKILMFSISKYDSMENALNSFEQSDKGQLLSINGWDVYMATNIDSPVVVWLDDNYCYDLYGPLSEDEMVRIINSISKGE
jgi:hypothetical protein